MPKGLQQCIKCGGRLLYDAESEAMKCVNCGKEHMTVGQKKAWLEEHRLEISKDLEEYGFAGVILRKWSISDNTARNLASRWKLKVPSGGMKSRKRPKAVDEGKKPETAAEKGKKAEIEFPAFNEEWKPSVQVAWLEAYINLCRLGRL